MNTKGLTFAQRVFAKLKLAGMAAAPFIMMALGGCPMEAGPSGPAFVPVTDIGGIPSHVEVNAPLDLTGGRVAPSNATNRSIEWAVKTDGGTNPTISGDTLTAESPGILKLTAAIAKGASASTPYTRDFTITVCAEGELPRVTAVTVSPATAAAAPGGARQFHATVGGTYGPPQTVTWSISSTGHKAGTSINANGKLTVAIDEPSDAALTIKAVSTYDPTWHDTATVTVEKIGYTNAELPAYLDTLTGNSAAAPDTVILAPRALSDLGTAGGIISGKQKYVVLDLSHWAIDNEDLAGGSSLDGIKTNTYVTGLILPDTITAIGYRAFYECANLERIVIPATVTSIGEWAFYGCASLEEIEIPDGVTTIGQYAFYGCASLEEIIIPTGVTRIGNETFSRCAGLARVTIPGGVTSIGRWAFYDCVSLEEITIPGGVTSIGQSAFSGCTSLEEIEIPDGVTTIEQLAFSGCASLESVTIPGSVTSIGQYAFYGCPSLEEIEIPDGVTTIGAFMFYNCESLARVTIPRSVTSIGQYAFYGCAGLEEITIPGGVTGIGQSAFSSTALVTVIFGENSSIASPFSNDHFPQGGVLWTAYNAANPKAGTYGRTDTGASDWAKR